METIIKQIYKNFLVGENVKFFCIFSLKLKKSKIYLYYVAFLSIKFVFFQFLDIRISVLGSVDAGKSTLLGVLCHGNLDDGQGHSRMNLFRHQHEVQTGRTSSISHKILGFDSKGNVSSIIQCLFVQSFFVTFC